MDSQDELQLNKEKFIGLCPPKNYDPVANKIGDVLQQSAELFYNNLSTDDDLLERLNYLAGYIEGAKEMLKLKKQ